ncbi:MAG: GNAT family N-acetyltransferase [Sulfolobaceae archaeon]|nr:GNAT family N-acetyltransferase [Sulfolobaceae archaeon]
MLSLSFTIREARPTDWHQIYELYNSLPLEDLYMRFFCLHRFSEEEAKRLVTLNDHVTIVVEVAGRIIGEGSLYNTGEFSLVVAPDFRGYGIGTEIVKTLIEKAKQLKMKKIFFYVLRDNIPMIRIGKKLGFKFIEEEGELMGYLEL